MTITIAPARNEYTASAAQTVFNYTFKIFSNTDLNVFITPLGQDSNDSTDLTTAYTVDAGTIGDEDGGFITLDVGTAASDRVTIVSNVPESRTTDYQFNGDFIPDTVNDDFDRVVQLTKQIEDRAGRTVAFQESQQGASSLTLPPPEATKFMRWKGDETGLENVDLSASGNPTNANVVTYSAGNNFTGGVDRTQEKKNAESASVKDFGAVGDGVADDTAALVAAFATGLMVFFPEGKYLCDEDTLTLATTGQTIYANKSRASDSATSGSAQIIFNGITPGAIGINVTGASCGINGLHILDKNDVGMIGIKGLRLTNTDDLDVRITDCIIFNFATAIDAEGRGLQVSDNIFALVDICMKTSWPTSGTEGTGDQALPNGYRSIKFVDNLCHAVGIMVDAQGFETDKMNGFVMTGNQGDVGERVFVGRCNRSVIDGNICLFTNSTPIFFTGDVSAVAISNNSIGGDINSLAQTPANIIRADGMFDQCCISGNTLGRCESHTINLTGTVLGGSITGNTFTDFAANATGFGVRLAGATCDRLVYGLNSLTTGSVSTKGGLLIEAACTYTDLQVQLNTVNDPAFSFLAGTDGGGNNIQT